MTVTDLPSPNELDGTFKIIEDHCDRIYTWNYERSRPQLVTLYNKAAQSQWASVTDLDWSTDVDPESLVNTDAPNLQLMREATKIPGSPISSWGDKELLQLGLEMFTAMLRFRSSMPGGTPTQLRRWPQPDDWVRFLRWASVSAKHRVCR